MAVAILPGTFDPVTNGHLDLIERACQCFERVVVAVGNNIAKSPWFSAEQRVQMLRDSIRAIQSIQPEVDVVIFEGLLIDCATEVGATVIVKGLRDGADLSNELVQATANRELGGLETLLLPTSPSLLHVSSSLVRELTRWGTAVDSFVPSTVAAALAAKRDVENWNRESHVFRPEN